MQQHAQTECSDATRVKHIDVTPTWKALMPLLLAALENGTHAGRGNALRSLIELAEKADAAHEMHKRMRAALDALAKAWPKAFGLSDAEQKALIEVAELLAITAPKPIRLLDADTADH
jgi:hypothetical protein